MRKPKGKWIVFIVECADGSFFADMGEDIRKKLYKYNSLQGIYFSKHPERLPVKVVFKDENLLFNEAFAKLKYLRSMNKKRKIKLIETKKWTTGRIIYEYLKNSGD